jgi:hypothetical protein
MGFNTVLSGRWVSKLQRSICLNPQSGSTFLWNFVSHLPFFTMLWCILAMLYQIQLLFSIGGCTVEYEMGEILWEALITSFSVFGGTEKILTKLSQDGWCASRVTIATNCRRWINVRHIIGHEWATSLLFLIRNDFLWNEIAYSK